MWGLTLGLHYLCDRSRHNSLVFFFCNKQLYTCLDSPPPSPKKNVFTTSPKLNQLTVFFQWKYISQTTKKTLNHLRTIYFGDLWLTKMICDGEFSRPTQRLPSFKQKQLLIVTTKSPLVGLEIFSCTVFNILFSGWVYFFLHVTFSGGESYIFLLNATDICGYFCLNYYFLTLSNHHMCCLYFQLFYKNWI